MEKKRILICGAGSIGIFLGTKIYAKNHDVFLFGRRKLKNVRGNYVFIGNKKFKIPEKLFRLPKSRKYDFIFITSKLYDFPGIVKLIKDSRTKAKILVAVQNGLVDCSRYQRILKKRIIPVCVFGGFRIERNNLKSFPTSVGWLTEYSKNGKEISRFISNCGIKCRAKKDLDSFRAKKMIVNCSLNGLSAIEKKTFKQLFSEKKAKEKISRLFDECYDILKQEYSLGKKEKIKKSFFKNWSNINHYSSTYQDIISGRKSESDFFNGFLVSLGKKHNLPTACNQEILCSIKAILKR